MWKRRRVPAFAAYLLIAGASALPAARILAQDATGPDTPPSQLPAEARERFQGLLEQGDAELEIGLINGALFYYDQAYLLHETNPDVGQRLEKVADLMIANAPRANDKEGLETYLRDIDNMMCRVPLRTYRKLIEQRRVAEQSFAALAGNAE